MALTPDTLAALPRIHTDRCELAALAMSDASELHLLTDDPAITDAVDFLPSPFTLADAENLILRQAAGRDRFIGIRCRTDQRLAGAAGAHLRGDDAIEVGYWIGAGFRERGYATEAASALVAALRTAFPRRQIMAECRPENRASWRVLTKIGFVAAGADGTRPGREMLFFSRLD